MWDAASLKTLVKNFNDRVTCKGSTTIQAKQKRVARLRIQRKEVSKCGKVD